MTRLLPAFCLFLLAAGALQAVLSQEPQDMQAPGIVQVSPPQLPHWDSFVLQSGVPETLLTVPAGSRFVLTDLWTMRHEEFQDHVISDKDRFWLERVLVESRKVAFDARMDEAPNPISWTTGISFGPGSRLVFQYEFAGEGKENWLRRIHFTGYFEKIRANS